MKGQRQKRNKKRIILGLTGSFGSGKTTVARIFKSFGCKIIDADRISHMVIKPDTKVYKKITNTFGKDILNKNRTINRNQLAQIVFNNKNLLKILNKIMHPEVIRTIKSKIKNSGSKIIILDAPLLIEAGLKKLADKLIVVKIKRIKQVERLMRKTPLSKIDILKRIGHQMSLADKVRLADFVIDNSGTMGETRRQVEKIRRLLWKN
jgi:dephospho-CoA kinase